MSGRKYAENLSISAVFKQNKAAPMDNRLVVENVSDLINASTWSSYYYPTMTVGVAATGDVYVFKGGNITSMDNWKKLARAEQIETLTGLWTFKGVAESISPDKRIIFVKNLHMSGVTATYECVGFEYDIAMHRYFKWVLTDYDESSDSDSSDSDETEPLYSVYSKEDDTAHLYRKTIIDSDDSSDSDDDYTVLYVQDPEGNLYFKTDAASGKEWERFTDGQKVYTSAAHADVATNVSFYLSSTATGTPLFTADIKGYVGSIFESIGDTSFYELPEAVTASSENNGWVYQVEDKEYASNGLIWVELGSPKEDLNWLVIS